eukprot:12891807-Prorocentrum_lima.AAC.1
MQQALEGQALRCPRKGWKQALQPMAASRAPAPHKGWGQGSKQPGARPMGTTVSGATGAFLQ